MKRYVSLREESGPGGSRELWASFTADGRLAIQGRDQGEEVARLLGARDYEWAWTISPSEVEDLRRALGGAEDLLEALRLRFSGDAAADLGSFLESEGISFERWSRLGD